MTQAAGTADAQTTEYAYDKLGRRIRETLDPEGLALTTRYEFDANDNVISQHSAGGLQTRFGYDALNRQRYIEDGTGTRQHTLYDAKGRQRATIDADGTLSEFIYNQDDQLIQTMVYSEAAQNLNLLEQRVVYVDGSLPSGARLRASGGDGWSFESVAGISEDNNVHVSADVSGLHQHYFYRGNKSLKIEAGDILYQDVYIASGSVPRELSVKWRDTAGQWHGAYWGAGAGVNSAHQGEIPVQDQWLRLSVSAQALGLVGKTVNGMAFTLIDGGRIGASRVRWGPRKRFPWPRFVPLKVASKSKPINKAGRYMMI